jgi:VWFA-related protein
MPRTLSVIFLASLLALPGAQQSDPQQQQQQRPPVFRGGTQLVRVDAYPTGKDGRIIEGLTADDFEVFEDGKPQKVETFEYDTFQTWTPDGERKDPASQQAAYDLAADPSWRVFVIVIDRAAYAMEGMHELQQSLHEFINRDLGPRDLFDVLTTDNEWIDLKLGQQTSGADAILDTKTWMDPAYAERQQMDALCAGPLKHLDDEYELFEGLVKLLGMIREEKKSILFVSNGLSAPRAGQVTGGPHALAVPSGGPIGIPAGPPGMGHGDVIGVRPKNDACEIERRRLENIDFERRFHDLLADARRANVAFYPINPRGLEAIPVHMDRAAPASQSQSFRELNALEHRNDSLLELAENTDGLAIVNTNDLAKGVRKIADAVSSYYILGYYPTNSKTDGTIRNITVRLKSTGKSVRARHQYLSPTVREVSAPLPAPESSVPTPVRDALNRLTVSVDRDAHGASMRTAASSKFVDPVVIRRRGVADEAGAPVFDRTEQVRLEWPTHAPIDHVEARLLDRLGHPLAAPIPATVDATRSPAVVVTQLPLASIAHGDYVLELTISAASTTEQTWTAFRVR